jgi:hypothetical protein
MYQPIEGGSKISVQGLECWIPPVGMVFNKMSGAMEKRKIISRSLKKEEQYWERTPLPESWAKKRLDEKKRQYEDSEYYDVELERYRQQEWDRRLNGCWIMVRGNSVYITGDHYYYLNWFQLDTGYPDYRDCDKDYFYFWEYCVQDPMSLGMVEVTGRRSGKSFRAGSILLGYTSRTMNTNSGIQSKSANDASKLYEKAIVKPFRKMPDFFRPVYDESLGSSPKKALRFYRTSKKGKMADSDIGMPELESEIDWRASDEKAYDGYKLHRYIRDEAGKTEEADVWESHLVVQYCFEENGFTVGKGIYTTTVEEMEAGGASFKKLWDASNQTERNANGKTKSGLYRFFTPVYKNWKFDRYGAPMEDEAKTYFINERASLQDDTRALSSIIRKKPFTADEAFRIDGSKCLYNAMKLNDQLDRIGWMSNVTTKGNLVWENGERDSKVVWEPNRHGRWEASWMFPDAAQANNVIKNRGLFQPGNKKKFAIGIDPYDHDTTVDERRSDGAAAVLKKYSSSDDDMKNGFVMLYVSRPQTAAIFYEDMIKTCFFFGAPMLFEDNKVGIKRYFEDRGYQDFLLWLPSSLKPGISGHKKTHQEIAEVTESYVENFTDIVFFKGLLNDWLNFDINNTTKYDAAMAAGYALIADQLILSKQREVTKVYEVTKLFRKYKIK